VVKVDGPPQPVDFFAFCNSIATSWNKVLNPEAGLFTWRTLWNPVDVVEVDLKIAPPIFPHGYRDYSTTLRRTNYEQS
jgi:hypothetical protein